MTAGVDRSRRLAVVTGGTSGIGRATAAGLAERGFRLVLVGRDRGRGEQAVRELAAVAGQDAVEFHAADLASLGQTRALARRLLSRHASIDVLVNNAGGQYADRRITEDGREATLATNVLTPLLLTLELLPALRAAAPSRVVFVNSDAHRYAKLVLDDLDAERSYRGLTVHARAKLLQLLVASELARRLTGTGVAVLAVNPGAAWTTQTAAMSPRMVAPVMRLWWPVIRMVQRRRTPQQAATSSLVAATDPALHGRTRVWIDEHGRIGEPGKPARDDRVAAQVYERVVGLLQDRPREQRRVRPD
jgi:NAD(P)-dependent dehydrogenase (short-subunit alcohol dehydrogenase family)